MAREVRDYSGGAVDTTLTSSINSTDLTIPISDATGWPSGGANGPFFVVIDYDLAGIEKVEVASRTGTTLTVANTGKRGVDDTAATSHSSGAKIRHCGTAQDMAEFNSHAFDTTIDDHGQYMRTDGTRHDLSARHAVGTVIAAATPGSIEPDDTAAEGVAASVARSDHTHGNTTAAAGTIQPDDTAAEGVATSFSRSDHKHAIVADTAAAISGTAAEGSATSFARSDHDHSYGAASIPGSALMDAIVTMAKLA
ncbi:MAG: hypothetical protein GWN07_32520, partial [Actinobacteria bacterium]|nr:hypothetical protein [Actinomycetota bacterium]NIS35477.1 hypothetical protein [Actinomycetota bacterium]NIU70148.1 hypothetical protein [Actinomycetota bacterium]NIW32030.1 hypothetical protein [Actinomycetota bacterium]NIX24281.1 hypothetical protein [Actinomycetota bacterium]